MSGGDRTALIKNQRTVFPDNTVYDLRLEFPTVTVASRNGAAAARIVWGRDRSIGDGEQDSFILGRVCPSSNRRCSFQKRVDAICLRC